MAFTESIYLIILFTLPAAMHIIYNTYIRNSPRIQSDKSVELAENIVFCIFVFIASIFISRKNVIEFADYIILSNEDKVLFLKTHEDFNYWKYIVNYTLITFSMSLLAIVSWYSIGKRIFKFFINVINKIMKRAKELEFSDLWRSLFETKEFIKKFDCCIVIEKAGNLVTAGLLQAYSPPHLQAKELLLYNTEQIKEILKQDAFKSPDDKIFYPAQYEYYDVSADMLIKFYTIEKFMDEFYEHSET